MCETLSTILGPVVAELWCLLCNGILDLSGPEGLKAVTTQSGFFACLGPWTLSPLSGSFIAATLGEVSCGG